MPTIFQLLKIFFHRKTRLSFTIPEFAASNKDLLIIVCDPKDDAMFVGYGGKHVMGKIKSAKGGELKVVKTLLRHSQFNTKMDQLIVSIVEALKVPLKTPIANEFFKFLDGAIFNISKAASGKGSAPPAGVPSPFMGKVEKEV